MSKSNSSRPKKKKFMGEEQRDRVDYPIENTKKPLKEKERSKKRIQKTMEINLPELLGENGKQPDHEKFLKKLIHDSVEKNRIQEKSVENLHEILGVNEKQPDHGEVVKEVIRELVKKKEDKISENKVDHILTENELEKEDYYDLSDDIGIDEDYDDIEIPKKKYLSITKKMRESISGDPNGTKPFQNYLNYLYFVEDHPNIQKLMQEHRRNHKSHHFRNFRYSDDIINIIKNKIAQKDLNSWMGKPGGSSRIDEMKKTLQLIKKFNSNANEENTEPWKLIKWVVEHGIGQYTVKYISKIVPLQMGSVRSHLHLMFKEKYNNYILDGAKEGTIRHRLVINFISRHVKNVPQYTGHYVEPGIPFPDYNHQVDHLIDVKYGEKYFLIDTTHSMRINSIVKKLIVYPPGDKAELLVVITNPALTQDYKNILIDQIFHFNERMKNLEGLKRDFIPKTTLKRIKLLNRKEFAYLIGIKENSEEMKELERICTIDRKGLLEMEKNLVHQKVKGNQDFEEFLKSRKISDIFARPDAHIRDNINYLSGLKEHYPIVLNFINYMQNLHKNEPVSSVNYGEINSFLKAIYKIKNPQDLYWENYETSKILNGLCENDSISKIGVRDFKITDISLNNNNIVNKMVHNEKIRGIFKRKNPPTFKEIHEFIDSHVNQYYKFKEKWQPIDSYKILKYYEKNLEGFRIKKKISENNIINILGLRLSVGRYFPIGDRNVVVKVDRNFIYCYSSINLKDPPLIFDRLTGKRIQFYQQLHNKGIFIMKGIKFKNGEKHMDKLAVVRINDKKNEISVFPDRNLNKKPIVFNIATGEKIRKIKKKREIHEIDKSGMVFSRITRKKIKFNQDLEDNGGFVYENKIYSIGNNYAGKNVLIKIDEKEKLVLFYPDHNLEKKPLVRPINESEVVQFFQKIDKKKRFTYKRKIFSTGKDFPCKSLLETIFPFKKVAVTVNESENRIYVYPDQDFNKPPVILNRITGKRIQFYQQLHNKGIFIMKGIKFKNGEKHMDKLAVVRINDKKNEISVFPDRNLNKKPIVFNIATGEKIRKIKKKREIHEIVKSGMVFNRITRKKIKFDQDLEDNGGFVYENKIYSIGNNYAGKNVLIKIDEKEKKVLFYPDHNLEKKPLERPIKESEVVQFFQKIDKRKRFTYKRKIFNTGKDFPCKKVLEKIFPFKKVAVTVNESEDRIYVYPDQDFNKPPVIFDISTGKHIQFYQQLHNEGQFIMKGVKFKNGEKHMDKLAVVRINEKKNEISVFPDRNLNKKPIVFKIATGEKIGEN